jgi:dihydroxy-acid dehydratase
MDATTNIRSRLPGRHVTEAPERAPPRVTDAALHLPIARPCGVQFDLFDVAEIFKKTPYVADSKPGRRYVAKDMFEDDGIPLLMKTLLDHGHLPGDCLTITGRTIAENLKTVKWNPHQVVVRSADQPITVTGGVAGLKGSLAPEGAVVKVAGMSSLKFTGPARCFDGEEVAFESVKRKICQEDEVDEVGPETAVGGPIALLQDGDIIEIGADVGILNVNLTGAEPGERKTKWRPRATKHMSGAPWTYAQQVGSAVDGAVTHPGGAHEKQYYADI